MVGAFSALVAGLAVAAETHVCGFGLIDFGGVAENETLRSGSLILRKTLAKETVLK